MLFVGLFGVLIAVSAYSLWRTYQGSEASLRYLSQEGERAALESAVLLDPERQLLVQELRTLYGILEGECLALKQGRRSPVQVSLAINPEIASWLEEGTQSAQSPELRRALSSAHQNIMHIWNKGGWGAREDKAPSGPQLAKAIHSVLQILEQTQIEMSRPPTPYR